MSGVRRGQDWSYSVPVTGVYSLSATISAVDRPKDSKYQFLLVGKASAWTGAIVGGAYAGIAVYVLPKAGELVAASGDVAGVVSSALGGAAMCVTGVVLERHCEAPPPPDGAQAVS